VVAVDREGSGTHPAVHLVVQEDSRNRQDSDILLPETNIASKRFSFKGEPHHSAILTNFAGYVA